jgi:hypothetical protein
LLIPLATSLLSPSAATVKPQCNLD